ncbi:type IV secretory system conjugative DNA transfer family protein [Actinomadura sp. SCN-SB]|uniref:type IV secretory system conjugative DNA transfer family protein n=1 Tax=Actinomadura sp. SCN-SB TaxID=3373092 RepID=UPI003751B144
MSALPEPAPSWTHLFDDLARIPDALAGLLSHHAPETALVITILGATRASAQVAARMWRTRRFNREARLVTVSIPPQVDPASAPAWWAHQTGLLAPRWKRWIYGQPHLAFEYTGDEAGLRVQVWVPGVVPSGLVEQTIRAAWPGATVTTRPACDLVPSEYAVTGGRLVMAHEESHPLKADYATDPLRPLLGVVSGLRRGEQIAVQILARPVTGRRLRRAHRIAAALRTGRSSGIKAMVFDLITPGTGRSRYGLHGTEGGRARPERAAQIQAVLAKAAQPRFEAEVRYAVATSLPREAADGWLRGHAHAVASLAALYSAATQYLRRRRLRHPAATLNSRHLGRGYLLSASELAALAHLPLDHDAPAITRAAARPVAPSPDIPTGPSTATGPARILGTADSGNPRPVALPVLGARQHVHVLGQTGVGKSTLLVNMVLADAREGRGALVVDPKGDLVTDILDRLPTRAVERTVLFDPSDEAPPPSVNILGGPDPAFAVDSVVSIFHRCYPSAWGPRLDDLLRSACLTLACAHGPRATLADIPRLLMDAPYRARLVGRLPDELLRGFWTGYDELSAAGRAALISPVMNKLRAVLLRPFVRQALAASESSVDLARHLDKGGLVLARLPKGVLGEDAARLLGSMLLAHTWQGITRRAALPEADRRDAAAYLDECHNFLNLPGSVSDILAEARGYRFSLVLAHQHLSQLPKDLRDAVSADARNKIYFAASPEDTSDLVRHAGPVISAHDLAHLGAYQAAARLVTQGRPSPAFTFRTRPLPVPINGRAEEVRQESRKRFASDPTSVTKALSTAPSILTDPRDEQEITR